MDNEKLEDLINKFFLKELTVGEKVEFEDYLKSSDQARKAFRHWNFVNCSVEAITFSENVSFPTPNTLPKKRNNIFRKTRVLQFVSILAIPLLISLAFWFIERQETPKEVVCKNGTNTSVLITLPDSSKVLLYAHSTLKYPSTFAEKERHVKLIGEATFEVVSNPQNPFYVEAIDSLTIKAYGTKFNVSSYENDDIIQVYLEKGKVNFSSPNLNSPQEMEPATKLEFNIKNNDLKIYPTDGAEYRAYEKEVLLFRSESLERITRKLSRVYDIDIVIGNNEVRSCLVTGSFKDKSIAQIMDVLILTTPDLKWKKENNIIILFK